MHLWSFGLFVETMSVLFWLLPATGPQSSQRPLHKKWQWPKSLVFGWPHFWQNKCSGVCLLYQTLWSGCCGCLFCVLLPPSCGPGHPLIVWCRYGCSSKCRCSKWCSCSSRCCSRCSSGWKRGCHWRTLAPNVLSCLSRSILVDGKLKGCVFVLDWCRKFWQHWWEEFGGHQWSCKGLNVLLQDFPLKLTINLTFHCEIVSWLSSKSFNLVLAMILGLSRTTSLKVR